ncbi:MAG: helix-turn-helix domain-containing protein [Dehalococcoidia bacterium]
MPSTRPDNEPQPRLEAGDYRISVRFGDAVLQAGHTVIPNLVLNHYSQLNISPGEFVLVVQLWSFAWTDRNPYPSLGTLAERLGVSRRQVRNYVHTLKGKGLLKVTERSQPGRGQLTSEYDFSPLLRATVDLEGNGTPPRNNSSAGPLPPPGKESSEAPRNDPSSEEDKAEEDTAQASKGAHAGGNSEESKARLIPDTSANRPPMTVDPADGLEAVASVLQRLGLRRSEPEPPAKVLGRAPRARVSDQLAAAIDDVLGQLTDDVHDQQNRTQLMNLLDACGLEEPDFVEVLYRAQALVDERRREPSARIRKDGAYFFAVLRDLLRGRHEGAALRQEVAPKQLSRALPSEDVAGGLQKPRDGTDGRRRPYRGNLDHSRGAATTFEDVARRHR